MTTDLHTALAEAVALREKATPGPWGRMTVGHRSVRQAAGAVSRALFMTGDPDIRHLMTDLTWVEADGDETHVGLTGNGPMQTKNADFIAAAANLLADHGPALLAALDRAERVEAAARAYVVALDRYTNTADLDGTPDAYEATEAALRAALEGASDE